MIQIGLEKYRQVHAGEPIGVLIRRAAEITTVVAHNPFQEPRENRQLANFLDCAPPANALEEVKNRKLDRFASGKREIQVDHGGAMADSRMTIAIAKLGTARNINTVSRLAEVSAAR